MALLLIALCGQKYIYRRQQGHTRNQLVASIVRTHRTAILTARAATKAATHSRADCDNSIRSRKARIVQALTSPVSSVTFTPPVISEALVNMTFAVPATATAT